MPLMIVHRSETILAFDILSDPPLCLVHGLLLSWLKLACLDFDDTEEVLEPLPVPLFVHLLLHQVDITLVFYGVA